MANNRSRNRSKKNQAAPEQVLIEGFLRGIWEIISWVIKKILNRGKSPKHQAAQASQREVKALQEHWEEVELHILQAASQASAVADADKILDTAFKLRGFPGETMADRLKAAEAWFPGDLYQSIWSAHKLRNTLAHEVGARVSEEEARRAIAAFRQALYKLGILS